MAREKIVMVRLTEDEWQRWQKAADAEERPLSNWIRRQCNAAAPDPIDTLVSTVLKPAPRKKGGK